jgi:hypothetical protein
MFGIKYDSEYEGRLILGASLDEVDSAYKSDEQILNKIDNDVPNNNKDEWLIKFNVNFNTNDAEKYSESSYGFLQIENGLIIGSSIYYQNFISNYFEKKKCSKNTIKSSSYSFYQFTCDNKNQFDDFPDLNLSFENRYNFTFKKSDLFTKKENQYFFLIIFQVSQININYWRLGQLFFRKYPTFLINDGKTGEFLYYAINKESGGGNLGLIIALSIIIPLIIICAVAFLIFHYRKRNKKSEELLTGSTEGKNDDSYPIIDN